MKTPKTRIGTLGHPDKVWPVVERDTITAFYDRTQAALYAAGHPERMLGPRPICMGDAR